MSRVQLKCKSGRRGSSRGVVRLLLASLAACASWLPAAVGADAGEGLLSEAALVSSGSVSVPPAEVWHEARQVNGVPVHYRATGTAFHEHRAEAAVCTDLRTLEQFVADMAQFADWVPFTRSAELLAHDDDAVIYYVRSTTPWPLKDRDMVYQISREAVGSGEDVRLSVTGLPDFRPPAKNASRIRAASGEWHLVPMEAGIRVSYRLYLDPGNVPPFLANQRLAQAVGQTLANLAARFPCGSV